MKLEVNRIYKGMSYTIGHLYIDGKYFCDTLEDKDRGLDSSMSLSDIKNIKVKNETAIPTGEYQITLNVKSPKYSNYAKYAWARDIEAKVPRLLNVKGFDGVLIHPSGNKNSDTSGCLLVGVNKVKGQVLNSRETFKELYKLLKDKHDKDEKITIKIL